MVTKTDTEIFIPISFNTYKRGKVNLLKTHLKTVNTLERIKRLNELQKIKIQQRRLLKKTIQEIKEYYKNLQNSLPTVLETGTPKPIYQERIYSPHHKTTTRHFQTTSRIDDELNKIQEQIKNLKI